MRRGRALRELIVDGLGAIVDRTYTGLHAHSPHHCVCRADTSHTEVNACTHTHTHTHTHHYRIEYIRSPYILFVLIMALQWMNNLMRSVMVCVCVCVCVCV